MRSPLSSRTNSRPKRVTPDEFFDLVASSVIMVLPSVSQLPSLNLPSLALFAPHVPPSPVKPGKSRQIVANENSLRETDVADVHANDQHIQDRPPFRATRVGAPFGAHECRPPRCSVDVSCDAGKPPAISTL